MTIAKNIRENLKLFERDTSGSAALAYQGPISDPDVRYSADGTGDQISKVTATLKSYQSGRYTKLGRNLKRIEFLDKKMKQLKEDTKQEARELVADLFHAEDAVRTRVVDTVSFVFHMTKDPAPTAAVSYSKVLKELESHMTPDLIKVMEELVAKHTSAPVQKAASLKATDKRTQESINEGLGDKLKGFFAKLKSWVDGWAGKYDAKLDLLKREAGLTESLDVNENSHGMSEFNKQRRGAYEVSLRSASGETMTASFYTNDEHDALAKAVAWANSHDEHGRYGPWEALDVKGPMTGSTYNTNVAMRGESVGDDAQRAPEKTGDEPRRPKLSLFKKKVSEGAEAITDQDIAELEDAQALLEFPGMNLPVPASKASKAWRDLGRIIAKLRAPVDEATLSEDAFGDWAAQLLGVEEIKPEDDGTIQVDYNHFTQALRQAFELQENEAPKRAPRTSEEARFTEKDLRIVHKDGWEQGRGTSPSYTGGYKAGFWDLSKIRAKLGLGPRG